MCSLGILVVLVDEEVALVHLSHLVRHFLIDVNMKELLLSLLERV